MNTRRLLVAGIGNIFLGDDAFGVETVRRLASRPLPAGVVVCDFGIRSFDLAYALVDGYDVVILVDATQQGGTPGTLYVIEPQIDLDAPPTLVNAHGLDPVKVLQLVRSMGGQPSRVLVVGCEPENVIGDDDWDVTPGLSQPVARAVDEAVAVIESLIDEAARHQFAQSVV